MKTLLFWTLILSVFTSLFLACTEPVSEEEKAREKVMMNIEETKESIDEYLTILEEKYTELLDSRIVDLEKALKKLRFDLKAHTSSERVEEKAKLLEDHKVYLQKKIADLKNSCDHGCDDFNIRIDSIFNELDAHLVLVDSLIENI